MSTDPDELQHPSRDTDQPEPKAGPERVGFVFRKSPLNRVIHVDGAWGGITAQGNINMALYSEYHDIAEHVEYPVDPETNRLGNPIAVDTPWVREIEVQAVINRALAEELVKWLNDQISRLDRRQELIDEEAKRRSEG